jgi:hypothetical protein
MVEQQEVIMALMGQIHLLVAQVLQPLLLLVAVMANFQIQV